MTTDNDPAFAAALEAMEAALERGRALEAEQAELEAKLAALKARIAAVMRRRRRATACVWWRQPGRGRAHCLMGYPDLRDALEAARQLRSIHRFVFGQVWIATSSKPGHRPEFRPT